MSDYLERRSDWAGATSFGVAQAYVRRSGDYSYSWEIALDAANEASAELVQFPREPWRTPVPIPGTARSAWNFIPGGLVVRGSGIAYGLERGLLSVRLLDPKGPAVPNVSVSWARLLVRRLGRGE